MKEVGLINTQKHYETNKYIHNTQKYHRNHYIVLNRSNKLLHMERNKKDQNLANKKTKRRCL